MNPFRITGPAVISNSGGRTSAYMTWRILDAHNGVLPPDVVICFANTGREMPGTLDFVRDQQAAWGVPITWLEYRRDADSGRVWADEVGHNSASRGGEPFEAMLAAKPFLPNPTMRFCTSELKVRTIERFVKSRLGWKRWTHIVGLRADEPRRVARINARNASGKDACPVRVPLADAGIEEYQVFEFWRSQLFDLRQRGHWEGNCDGCFLKNRGAITRMLRDHPERMAWWARMESVRGGCTIKPGMALFRADRENYAQLTAIVRDQGVLPFDLTDAAVPCDIGCGI